MCCAHLNRRQFLGTTTALMAGAGLIPVFTATPPAWADDLWDPARPYRVTTRPLRVQPILMYRVPVRREQTSWKSWGGIQSDEAAAEEARRIADELNKVAKQAEFSLEILPVAAVTSEDGAAHIDKRASDVTVLYPATGTGGMLQACVKDTDAVIFVRHKSGPVYYWYEALSTRYLQPDSVDVSTEPAPRLSVHDVVVDDCGELLWRLRARHGMRNLIGSRIVAVGGPMGKYAPDAPDVARDRYKLDIVDVSYEDLAPRIRQAMNDPRRLQLAERWADLYLAIPRTALHTDRRFVVNCFLLYGVFKDLLLEHEAALFTIKECMSTVIPMSQTTACLTLGLLNDEGFGAFCESDFVIIPAGILLHYITSKPVFLHNSTFPHDGMVTCAHCTGPRRMNGERYEPADLVTHYESEYGAAPKIEMPIGQEVTFINPEYSKPRWVGMTGTVEANPFYEICRSQQDVRIHGNWRKLLNEVRDSHWVMAYGNYLKEVEFAARRMGITFENISLA